MMKKINTPINDLKSVLDTIQSGIISIDKDKFLIFFNDKAKRIFSLSEAFIGKPISGIVTVSYTHLTLPTILLV